MGSVSFVRVKEVLWSHNRSVGWFPYSWDTAKVSNVPSFERVENKRSLSKARFIVEEYAEFKVFIRAGTSLLSVVNAHRRFSKWRAEGNDPGDNGEGGAKDGPGRSPARFRSTFDSMIAAQTNIGAAIPSTLGDVLSLGLWHSEAVVVRLKKCKDAKDAAQACAYLVEREWNELKESFSSSKDRVDELSVAKGSSVAAVVALRLEWHSLKEALAASDALLERVQWTANAKSNFVKLLNDRLVQERIFFKTTKAALEAQLSEAKSQPDTAYTEVTNQRDRLRDEVDRLSTDRTVLSVEPKITRRDLGAAKSEVETIGGQLTEKKRMKEEAEQKMTDILYEMDGVKAKISQLEGREGRVQESVRRILRRAGRLKAAVNRIRDQLVEHLQLYLDNYIRTAFSASEALTTLHLGRVGGYVHAAVDSITDGLKDHTEVFEDLCGLSANYS